jgi:hypothetical protein
VSVLKEDELIKNLDFKCARCQIECSKVNAAEPELGYVSHAPGHEGEFVGPLCTNCYTQTPENDRVIRKLPETAFLVVVRQDGEGAYLLTEGVGIPFLREPTFNDIIAACNTVSRDVHDALVAQKITAQVVRTLASGQKSSKLIVPR